MGGNFSFFIDAGPDLDVYHGGYTNDTCRLGGLQFSKENGGEHPDGGGLFMDGPDVLK